MLRCSQIRIVLALLSLLAPLHLSQGNVVVKKSSCPAISSCTEASFYSGHTFGHTEDCRRCVRCEGGEMVVERCPGETCWSSEVCGCLACSSPQVTCQPYQPVVIFPREEDSHGQHTEQHTDYYPAVILPAIVYSLN